MRNKILKEHLNKGSYINRRKVHKGLMHKMQDNLNKRFKLIYLPSDAFIDFKLHTTKHEIKEIYDERRKR